MNAARKWNSRKLAGALGTVLTMVFGLDIPDELLAQLIAGIAGVYIAAQGIVDWAEARGRSDVRGGYPR